MVLAKTSVNVVLNGQLRQGDGACLLCHFVKSTPKYVFEIRSCFLKKVVIIWVDMDLGSMFTGYSSAPNVKRAFVQISGWFLPLYSLQMRGRSGEWETSAFLRSVSFFETQFHLRRARTCTPEDAPFNINSVYLWYPRLVLAWGRLHSPPSVSPHKPKTSVTHVLGATFFARYTLRKKVQS